MTPPQRDIVPPPATSDKAPRTPAEASRTWAIRFVLLMLVAMIISALPVPLRFGLVVAAPLAGVVGIIALVQSFRAAGQTSLRVLLIVGEMFAGYFALLGLSWVILAPQIMAHEDCLDTAITQARIQRCQTDFEQSVTDWQDSILREYGLDVPAS